MPTATGNTEISGVIKRLADGREFVCQGEEIGYVSWENSKFLALSTVTVGGAFNGEKQVPYSIPGDVTTAVEISEGQVFSLKVVYEGRIESPAEILVEILGKPAITVQA